jgi:hypothetical protein
VASFDDGALMPRVAIVGTGRWSKSLGSLPGCGALTRIIIQVIA